MNYQCAYAFTFEQAMSLGHLRADRTSVRQRVELCRDGAGRRHFIVKPVDRVPSSVMA